MPIDESTNRRVVERLIIENHFRGLGHLLRQLDSGLLEPELQQAHAAALTAIETVAGDVMPVLFEALDMIDPYRADIGRLIRDR